VQLSPELRAVSEVIATVQQQHSEGDLSICAAHASGPKVPGPETTMTIWFLVATDDLLGGEAARELNSQLQAAVHRELSNRGFPDLAGCVEVKLSSLASHDIGECVAR
jgi:hypothetical protein